MSGSAFRQLTPHVYWLAPDATTDRPVLGAIAGSQRTLLVDAGNSPAHARLWLGYLADADVPPPTYLVLTHWHWDHVFEASVFEVPIVAHRETRRIVADMAGLDWSDAALDQRVERGLEIAFCRDMIKAELPNRSNLEITPPDVAFEDRLEIDLGDVRCEVVHVGGDHAGDSSVVYVREDQVMFVADCLAPDIYSETPRYTRAIVEMMDRLLRYDAELYLAGHSDEPLSRGDMIGYARLFDTIANLVERHGQDRATILTALQEALDAAVDEEHVETVDAFLAGAQPSNTQVTS